MGEVRPCCCVCVCVSVCACPLLLLCPGALCVSIYLIVGLALFSAIKMYQILFNYFASPQAHTCIHYANKFTYTNSTHTIFPFQFTVLFIHVCCGFGCIECLWALLICPLVAFLSSINSPSWQHCTPSPLCTLSSSISCPHQYHLCFVPLQCLTWYVKGRRLESSRHWRLALRNFCKMSIK